MSTTLPELPPISTKDSLPYSLIREVSGYPESYVQQYARAYGLAVWKAAIQHAADHCQERSRDWIGRGNTVNWEYRAHGAEDCAESLLSLPLPEQGSPQ